MKEVVIVAVVVWFFCFVFCFASPSFHFFSSNSQIANNFVAIYIIQSY